MSSRAVGSVLCACLCVSLFACGDDDTRGPGDASTDAATTPDSGGIFIPRRDSGTAPAVDPIRECDRFDSSSCPAGQTCDVIVRVFEGTNQLSIYAGCVTTTRERGLGDPCDPDITATTPYQTEGLTDLVWRDQCGPGLICAPDPKIRGGSSCQPTCVTGTIPEDPSTPILCEDPKSFCVAAGPFQEFCRPSDGCDVVAQTGCRGGLACYLRMTDDGEGFLSVCYPPAPAAMMVADGQPCRAYNVCRPGSSCNVPLSKPPSQWMDADVVCRPACAEDGTLGGDVPDDDAGQEDGGTSGGRCAAPRACRPFGGSGLRTSAITNPPYGQCE